MNHFTENYLNTRQQLPVFPSGVYIITLFIILSLLSSCSTTTSNSQQLITKINNDLKRNYQIEHGHIVAAYDLAKIHKNHCIYAKDYGKIINEENYNNLFFKQFHIHYKAPGNLEAEAAVKLSRIKELIRKINNKYQFLSSADSRYFKPASVNMANTIFDLMTGKATNNTHLHELTWVDKILSNLPIMLPEFQPQVTSHYGMRRHPKLRKRIFHCGIDIVTGKAGAIYSAANGKVTVVGRANGYGNIIQIQHGHNFKTRYAHLKTILVKEGDNILRGQKIGIQGNTGNVTREHLHFEIWLNNKHIDPFDFIAHSCKC